MRKNAFCHLRKQFLILTIFNFGKTLNIYYRKKKYSYVFIQLRVAVDNLSVKREKLILTFMMNWQKSSVFLYCEFQKQKAKFNYSGLVLDVAYEIRRQ